MNNYGLNPNLYKEKSAQAIWLPHPHLTAGPPTYIPFSIGQEDPQTSKVGSCFWMSRDFNGLKGQERPIAQPAPFWSHEFGAQACK